ncbi:uncharacterized protein [Pocillopora verrucosa]|uniref:uncharacterized protein n=1 Tax=Pocillopora verrucosa TaxID=203993 RepID=UPI00333F0230
MEPMTGSSPVPKNVHLLVLLLSFAMNINGQQICASLQPCQNSGSCSDTRGTYVCHCVGDFTGRNCSSLTFTARIGVSQLVDRDLIPHITAVFPPDLTNYNAQRQYGPVAITVASNTPFPKTFKWSLNGSALRLNQEPTYDRVLTTRHGDLGIKFGILSDEGDYQVFMSNAFGTMFSKKVGLKFSVVGPFSIYRVRNVSMVENESFRLPCGSLSYKYRVSYSWSTQRPGMSLLPISSSFRPRILMEPNGDLLFSPVTANDVNRFMASGGRLKCSVTDLHRARNFISPDIFLHVKSSASQNTNLKFYTTPAGSYTLATGDQFYLNCTVGGSETPDISWYKDNVKIVATGDLFQYMNYNRTLRLGSLRSSSHNGIYKCVAGISGAILQKTTTLKVIDKIEPVYDQEVHPFYDIREGKHGGTVTLFCNTTGDLKSSPTWYYNGEKLQHSLKFLNRWSVSSSSGILTIRNLKVKDFGVFQCVVKNPVSENYRVSYLVVTGAPLPPVNVKTTNCSNFSTILTWDVRLLSDLLPPDRFIIEWSARYASLEQFTLIPFTKLAEVPSSVRSYAVNNLKPNTEVHFRIRAKNQIGVGFPGLSLEKPLCITRSKRPTLYPKNLQIVPRKVNGELQMNWTTLDPLDWGGAGCKYRVFYRPNTPNAPWTNKTSFDRCDLNFILERGVLTNQEYEVRIRTENIEGPGPMSPSIFGLSGQNRLFEPPTDITVVRVNASSVEIKWTPFVPKSPQSVDGHYIYIWQGRRTYRQPNEESVEILLIPDYAIRVKVVGGNIVTGVVSGLTPWTNYTVVVQGYNSAGLGPPSDEVVFVRTLDSQDSYYILTLRIISENFSEDLKDPISSRFKALKENVTREITKLYSRHGWFKRATVLSFSPGSVQAEIQLEAASPNMSFLQQVVSQADNLGNFSLDRNRTKLQSQAGIQSVTIQASHLMVNVTGRFVINCTVIGGPPDLQITWSKGGNIIGLSHRTKVETNRGYSRLTVRDAMASDEGVYVCQAGKGSQIGTANVSVQVVPVLRISPRAVSEFVGGKASFSCTVVSGVRQGASVVVVEVTSEGLEFLNDRPSYTATNLEIPDGGESYVRKFVCVMRSQEGSVLAMSEMAELIIIKPDVPRCQEEWLKGVLWSATAAEQTDIKPCPPGARGKVSRFCAVNGKWENANFVDCSSREFLRLGDEIEAVTEGFQTNFTAKQILSELLNVTLPSVNSTQKSPEIFGGDLVIAVNVLVKVADYNAEQGNVSNEEDVKNFVQVASNLLEPVNRVTWQELENLGDSRSRILVKAVDDYGLGVAATFTGSSKYTVVQATNVLNRIDRVQGDNPLRTEGLSVSYNQSSIHLPGEAFSSSPDSRAITSVLLTLNDVLPLDKETKDKKQAVTANTTVVSSTVYPRPPNVFKQPVKIVLENKRVNVPAEVDVKRKCVFWRPGGGGVWQTNGCRLVAEESNVSITTCECNHLTVFASLMDPHDAPIEQSHKKALEIISIIGCSISLLAVIVTMVVTVFFWRAVKSPRAKVLLNLCAAIAICCILVIAEGSARNNETGCTIMAALLHYFLLALFCWMLCEGVLLYILLVKVFGGGADDKVKYFYLLGWGFPAVIVAISLGATQAVGYGSSEACWLDVKSGVAWAFIGPAILIISINIVVFILVIRQMMGTRHIQNKTQFEKVKAGVKASAVVLPLLGIAWLFGLLSISSSTIAFKYIFVIANSLQGLMIFIFHCLLNKQIQDAVKRIRDKSSSGASTTPKTKPSPVQNPKNVINLTSNAKKKRSNKAQNDYEMVDSLKSQSDSPLPRRDAINDMSISEEPENPKAPLQKQPPLYDNEKGSPHITCAQEKNTRRDSVEETAEQNTSPNSGTKSEGLTQGGSTTVPSTDDILCSIDGITNHINEKPPGYDVPLFHKTPDADKILNDGVPSRMYENSPIGNASSEDIELVITQEDVACVLEDEPPLQGAVHPESNDRIRTVKQDEPREAPDDVKNDEDFDRKMAERRAKVDTVQKAADEFRSSSQKFSTETQSSGSLWRRLRQNIFKDSYKAKKTGISPDLSDNRRDVYDTVEDQELV